MTSRAGERADAVKADAAPEYHREPTWPAAVAVVVALALQLALPEKLVYGPRWLIPVLEGVLLLPLLIGSRYRHHRESALARLLSLTLTAVISLANLYSLIQLAYYLIHGGKAAGQELILSSILIWLTNVIIFGLWYWEIDRGGPGARTREVLQPPEFLYPQMINPEVTGKGWRPAFLDYMYVSLTNATAFSPTDTMPLSQRVKSLMGIQALASLITVALVGARAVNILS
ncbi:MAG: hypothetical protein ACR2MZ_12830 [Candidatus Dormibacter sp.]|uniref:hypothetical protein n=1 Tax=Candidatus Dormibacter sp. TaxID=2973982 RepID=UPI003D9BBAB3